MKTMQILNLKKTMLLFIIFTLIFSLGVITSEAQQMIKVAGKMTAAYTIVEEMDVGDVEDHIVALGESHGTNANTGKSEFMDGARIVNLSFSDLVQGNGPHQGYITLFENGDTVISKWEGKITTTLSDESTPSITFEGTMSWIKTTGRFENMQGSGTYSGRFISESDYTVDWQGEYFIKK
jgi:hypothetical protein